MEKMRYKNLRIISLVLSLTLLLPCLTTVTIAVSAANDSTIGSILDALNVDVSDAAILTAVTEGAVATRSSGGNLVQISELVITEPQGGTSFSQQRISLLDENRETVLLVLQTQSNESVQYRDNTINVDINFPIYGDISYRYVVTYGADYDIDARFFGSRAMYLVRPTGVFIRTSSYASTTHDIETAMIAVGAGGFGYNSNYEEESIGETYQFYEEINYPFSGRTYSFSCENDYYDNAMYPWIGIVPNVEVCSFIVTYTIHFDDGEEVANTRHILS